MRTINISQLSILRGYPYECTFDWPADCFVQAGDNGIVFVLDGSGKDYRTAFFEAFPKEPATFIRGEGKTIAEAESAAWSKYEKALACPGHEFERRGYTNGLGFCKRCNMSLSHAFEPSTRCCVCAMPTNWTSDAKGLYYCEEHHSYKPLADWTPVDWHIAYMENEMHGEEK